MRVKGNGGGRRAGLSDRDLWRRSREAAARPDEAEQLMDLAAFAEDRLDDDETARVAAMIARDADAAADVAAARALARGGDDEAYDRVVARAAALVKTPGPTAMVIAFPPPRAASWRWSGAATWSGLAAAVAFAGWLGFDLGSGLSDFPPFGLTDNVSASEIYDATPPLVRDFIEGWQT